MPTSSTRKLLKLPRISQPMLRFLLAVGSNGRYPATVLTHSENSTFRALRLRGWVWVPHTGPDIGRVVFTELGACVHRQIAVVSVEDADGLCVKRHQ